MNATEWATFWVFLALLVFIGILLYMKVPAMAVAALDKRAAKIRADLDEARAAARRGRRRCSRNTSGGAARRRPRRRRSSSRRSARRAAFAEEARARIADYVTRRTKAVETRIAQAETQAVAEVRSRAIDVAAAAAGRILAEEAKGRKGDVLVERAIETVRKSLN